MVTIDGYPIDAAPSEDHGFASEVTSHPVEEGADVTDHVRAQPITLSLDCVVSNTPIGEVARLRGDLNGDGTLAASPSKEALDRLLAIRDARQPVIVETDLRVYRDMVLQSISIPVAIGNGDALRFRASFVQVVLVSNERTFVKVATPRAAKKRNLGHKPSPVAGTETPGAPPAPPQKTKSWAASAVDAVGGLF